MYKSGKGRRGRGVLLDFQDAFLCLNQEGILRGNQDMVLLWLNQEGLLCGFRDAVLLCVYQRDLFHYENTPL